MAPLFFFLASSLNVELVYIILKSLTQFVYIDPETQKYARKQGKEVSIVDSSHSNHLTLELSKIKIKNYSNWSSASGADLYQNEYFAFQSEKDVRKLAEEDRLEINLKVRVTYYNMGLFRSTFKSFFINQKVLHASLSPKFNLEQVFGAGEAAGKSGSFFFFSHDRRFIIKTMTDEELTLF